MDPKLVAYTGEQPAGFTLDRVPDGWEVQGVNRFFLMLAPQGGSRPGLPQLCWKGLH